MAHKIVAQLFTLPWNALRKTAKDVVDYEVRNRDLDDAASIEIDPIYRKKPYLSCLGLRFYNNAATMAYCGSNT